MSTNVAFQLEVVANAVGEREITSLECDPTTEDAEGPLGVAEVDGCTWEFRFVVEGDFDGSEPVFRRFAHYKLDPKVVFDACRAAAPAPET
jgi:hypothetical protein